MTITRSPELHLCPMRATSTCVGSTCMAWREVEGTEHTYIGWTTAQWEAARLNRTGEYEIDRQTKEKYLEYAHPPVVRPLGYCGLAGKP